MRIKTDDASISSQVNPPMLSEKIRDQIDPAVLFALMARAARLVEPRITFEKKPTVMKWCVACNGMMPHTIVKPQYCVVCGPEK